MANIDLLTIAGFCEPNSTWIDCAPTGISTVFISDDELYRKLLKVRRYQILALYDIESLTEAIQILWGPTAVVLDAGNRRVVIAPGRELTPTEKSILQIYPRVLPIAPGIALRFHFGSLPVFGFGEGWGGFCETTVVDLSQRLLNEFGVLLLTEDDQPIGSGQTTIDAPWMCEVDVLPYDCAA